MRFTHVLNLKTLTSEVDTTSEMADIIQEVSVMLNEFEGWDIQLDSECSAAEDGRFVFYTEDPTVAEELEEYLEAEGSIWDDEEDLDC